MSLRVKICGMRETENIMEVAKLKPDMMGFIFHNPSPRNADHILDPLMLRNLSPEIKKTGVFVNAALDLILGKVKKYSLDIVQLHGHETPEICFRLQEKGIKVIKTFSINMNYNFSSCSDYISCTEYFLFDTFHPDYGGSGIKFDWKELNKYILDHPFILSGGISPNDANYLLELDHPKLSGIDINSRFEIKPGIKDTELIRKFIAEIRQND